MEAETAELIAETNYLHALWNLGPPSLQQPPYRHPQPPYHYLQPPYYYLQPMYYHPVPPYYYHPEPPFYRPYPPSTSVYIVPSSNIPASSSEASAKPLQLPPPETVNKGDINGSRDVTVPFHGELCKEKGEAEEIVNEGHMEGSMPVTEVSEKKGKAQRIVNEVNMEGVIFEGELRKEQSKAEAKAFLECEDGLADANKVLGDEELCLSDVQLLVTEDIAIEGHMEGSMHVTKQEIFNDVNMEASAADMVIPEVEVCKEQSKTEAKAVLENEDVLADANNLTGGSELCLSNVQLLQDEEITREGDMGGSVEAIVLCPGEVCVMGKENASEVTSESSCKGGTLLVKKCPSCEETVNRGDINGSRDVTVPFQGVYNEKGEAEDIANEGHMEKSMHVTEKIFNDVNMEASAADMVILEVEVCKEQSKTEAKAVLENEDALADAYNPEITREGDVGGSVEAIVLCPGEICVKGKENGCEVTTDSSCEGGTLLVKKCPSCEETVNEGDINGSRDVTFPFQGEVCKQKGEAEEIDKEGHMEGSMPVMEVFEKKSKADRTDTEVYMEGSIPVSVIFVGGVPKEQGKAKVIFVEGIFNEVNLEGSAADMVIPEVEVCKEQSKTEARTNYRGVDKVNGKWRSRYYDVNQKKQLYLGKYETKEEAAAAYDKAALRFKRPKALLNFPERHSNELKLCSIGHKKIVDEVNMEGPTAETAEYEGEVCKEQGKTEKTGNDGEKQGLIDASVSCLGEASKEKGKTEEDVGAGINHSTSIGGRWLLKKCSENSSGPTPSEPQFVMYDIHSGSHVQQMPRLNPADTQALGQSSSLEEYTEGKEVIKNLVWGNTFFVSKRAAKLLGHILAGGFQFTPSLPDKPASQPTLPAKRPHPRTRKPKARA